MISVQKGGQSLPPPSDAEIDTAMAEKPARRWVRHVDDDHGTVTFRPAGVLYEIGLVVMGAALGVIGHALWVIV